MVAYRRGAFHDVLNKDIYKKVYYAFPDDLLAMFIKDSCAAFYGFFVTSVYWFSFMGSVRKSAKINLLEDEGETLIWFEIYFWKLWAQSFKN